MVLVAGIRPDAETGGIVSVVAIVQANRPEVLNTALSVRSKKVFMTDTSCFRSTSYSEERRTAPKLALASLMVCAGNGQIFLTNKTPLKNHIK
jgi:hypothetical protein